MMFKRHALRRRLAAAGAAAVSDDQLRRLARALDSGAAGTECVPGPGGAQLRLAASRAFRFPDLRELGELRRLPLCTDQHCCNPYHWSRLCKPGTSRPMTCATSACKHSNLAARCLVCVECSAGFVNGYQCYGMDGCRCASSLIEQIYVLRSYRGHTTGSLWPIWIVFFCLIPSPKIVFVVITNVIRY